MPDPSVLLARYRRSCSTTRLRATTRTSAAVITDHPGNMLKRLDGTVLASAASGAPGGGVPALTLGFLGPDTYPTGDAVLTTDYVDQSGEDYVAAALNARQAWLRQQGARPRRAPRRGYLAAVLVLHVLRQSRLLRFGARGDLEMIQLRLDAQGQPQEVSYAQHRSGVRAPWSYVEQEQGAPVVYSARGSHASMLRAGTIVSDRSFLPTTTMAAGRASGSSSWRCRRS